LNAVKDMLKAGKTVVGTTADLSSPAGWLAESGFDFILFDTQHAPVEIKELKGQLEAMRGKKAIPIVRVGENNQALICYALDIGAKGIISPMIDTKKQAEDLVKWCKYPPEGVRSNAGVRGEWGTFAKYRDYLDTFNREVLIIPMIETVESLNNIDEILSVPGIDVLLVGPSDFSITLDVTLDYENPKYIKALKKVADACKRHHVTAAMYFVPPGWEPNRLVDMGFKLFTLPWNSWATDGVAKGLSAIKR
jgi:2-keto-3-deoxy-L-rhamnonate aldolase RhmA